MRLFHLKRCHIWKTNESCTLCISCCPIKSPMQNFWGTKVTAVALFFLTRTVLFPNSGWKRVGYDIYTMRQTHIPLGIRPWGIWVCLIVYMMSVVGKSTCSGFKTELYISYHLHNIEGQKCVNFLPPHRPILVWHLSYVISHSPS